jgi:hypothetical protein
MSHPLPPKNHPLAWHYKAYQGWDVFIDEEDFGQGKVKKIYFAVNQATGEIKEIDISPYGRFPDLVLIIRVIDAGFPSRIGPSPLTHKDLDQIEAYGKAAE